MFLWSLRSSSSKLAQLTLEQMLEHLDSLRLNLGNTKNNCEFNIRHLQSIKSHEILPGCIFYCFYWFKQCFSCCISLFPDTHITSPTACSGQLWWGPQNEVCFLLDKAQLILFILSVLSYFIVTVFFSSARFSDIFSLAEEYEDSSKQHKPRRKAPASSPRSRRGAAPQPSNEEDSESSSASVNPRSQHDINTKAFRPAPILLLLSCTIHYV